MWPFTQAYPELKPDEIADRTYDYIVVGGGTAGCVLASRLSSNPNISVLVIERGRIADTYLNRIPLISANLYAKDAFCAIFDSAPVAHANGRKLDTIIGEGLGGGSRVNSCVYTRGVGDYNRWLEAGREGWGYEQLEGVFKTSECALSRGESKFRGKSGPWVNQTIYDFPFKPHAYVYRAAERLGFPHISDINSPDEPTCGIATLDITTNASGERESTMHAFLPKKVALARKNNLHICPNTIVSRLDVSIPNDGGNGKPKVQGVFFQDSRTPGGKVFKATPRKEVILCAGAITNPQILMLSGIGPKEHLKEHGITLVKDMPGVGSSLGDHCGVPMSWEVPIDDSLHIVYNRPLRVMCDFIRYTISGNGLFSMPFLQSTLFVKTSLLSDDFKLDMKNIHKTQFNAREPGNVPDIEIMPSHHRANPLPVDPVLDKIGIFNLTTTLVQPKSLGSVRLRSSSPFDRPIVDLGFLSHPADIVALRKGLRLSLNLAREMGEAGYALTRVESQLPASESDEDLDQYIKENIRSCLHYTSTCRMAPEVPRDASTANVNATPGVVDDELRVHGINGLRIADTSICPDVVSTHTMAVAVVVAEKCALLIQAGNGKS